MGVVVEVPVWGSSLSFSQGSLRQRGPADPFVAAMKRAGSRKDRLVLAIRALRRDPDCIEANLVVAAACTDLDRRLAYLNIAVEAGELLWGCVDGNVSLAAVKGARPWLRAIMVLGETLAEAGDADAADECFDRLRVLDPGDTLQAQAARMRLHAPTAPGMLP